MNPFKIVEDKYSRDDALVLASAFATAQRESDIFASCRAADHFWGKGGGYYAGYVCGTIFADVRGDTEMGIENWEVGRDLAHAYFDAMMDGQ